MSHDLHFVKGENLETKTIERITCEELKVGSAHFIDDDLRKELIQVFRELDKDFELHEDKAEGYTELSFSSFQISLFSNMLSISIPYWDENNSEQFQRLLHKVCQVP